MWRALVLILVVGVWGCSNGDGQETPSPTPDVTPVEMPSECPDEVTVPMTEVWAAWGR